MGGEDVAGYTFCNVAEDGDCVVHHYFIGGIEVGMRGAGVVVIGDGEVHAEDRPKWRRQIMVGSRRFK